MPVSVIVVIYIVLSSVLSLFFEKQVDIFTGEICICYIFVSWFLYRG